MPALGSARPGARDAAVREPSGGDVGAGRRPESGRAITIQSGTPMTAMMNSAPKQMLSHTQLGMIGPPVHRGGPGMPHSPVKPA